MNCMHVHRMILSMKQGMVAFQPSTTTYRCYGLPLGDTRKQNFLSKMASTGLGARVWRVVPAKSYVSIVTSPSNYNTLYIVLCLIFLMRTHLGKRSL